MLGDFLGKKTPVRVEHPTFDPFHSFKLVRVLVRVCKMVTEMLHYAIYEDCTCVQCLITHRMRSSST
jgi:hypothetical protein